MKLLKPIGFTVMFLALMSFNNYSKTSDIDNTVCSTGTIESAEFGTVTMTVCYTGPETGRALAAKLRAKIADVRAQAD